MRGHTAYQEIDFLGHIVGEGFVKPKEDKLAQIFDIAQPKTKKHIMSLLGLVGYYRKFIKNFAEITKPLTDLIKKGCPMKVKWNHECEESFRIIKLMFSKDPILILPNLNKPFVVRTDASDVALGAVLMQEKNDLLMPCSFQSRKLLPRETKYPIIERECLAIIFAISKFSRYLLLSEFVIETDHKPLVYLKERKTSNSRLLRWALALQEFRFLVRPIPGRENVQADVMSRLV